MERKPEDFEKGLVSVITPVYNVEKYIDRTLSSVFAQTYKNIEIVLVDDQSEDKSAEIIQRYLKSHPEIIYYLQPKNMGAGAARNKALELAKGQYVAFLDADDIWFPEKTEKQIKLLSEKNGAFSYTAIQMIDQNDNIVKRKRCVKEEVNYKFLLRNTMIATSTVLIDRTRIGDIRMPLRRGGQDYATWLRILREGEVAYGVNEVLESYRVGNRESLAGNKWKSLRQVWEIQTIDEGISRIKVSINLLFFILNAIKKYLF